MFYLVERSGVLRIYLFVWTLMWNVTLDTCHEYIAYLIVKLLYYNCLLNISLSWSLLSEDSSIGHIGRDTTT